MTITTKLNGMNYLSTANLISLSTAKKYRRVRQKELAKDWAIIIIIKLQFFFFLRPSEKRSYFQSIFVLLPYFTMLYLYRVHYDSTHEMMMLPCTLFVSFFKSEERFFSSKLEERGKCVKTAISRARQKLCELFIICLHKQRHETVLSWIKRS